MQNGNQAKWLAECGGCSGYYMKLPKPHTGRRMSRAAEDERENERALYLSVLRIMLQSMSPEQRTEVSPKVRAVCEEFSG